MREPTPDFLLANPDLVAPVAPWCTWLENVELGILLLAQPWLAGEGMRRAELERQLSRLARDLPVGPVYFQRVHRAVARLESIGALASVGGGRARRFSSNPQGFAALVVNLRVLRADPALDASEFELKRALVAMWSLAFRRLSELPEEVSPEPELLRFLDDTEAIEIWGRRIITEKLVRDALDVLDLISIQRRRVEQLLARSERRLERLAARDRLLDGADLAELASTLPAGAAVRLVDDPAAARAVRTLAASALPSITLRARVLRYRRYLDYLADLSTLYSEELAGVDLEAWRGLTKASRR